MSDASNSKTSKQVSELLKTPTVHHCGEHDFATLSYDEMQKHNQDVEHTYTGVKSCKDCGKPNLAFSKKIKLTPTMKKEDIPVYCQGCLDRIVKEQAQK